jgi:hypothetical protein
MIWNDSDLKINISYDLLVVKFFLLHPPIKLRRHGLKKFRREER